MLSLYGVLGEISNKNDDSPKDLRLITGFMQPLIINIKLHTSSQLASWKISAYKTM